MVGFIFKYQATPAGDLRDEGEMPDPDFWHNKRLSAVWAICGPYRRQALAKAHARGEGGIVFFVPYAPTRRELALEPVCTGVLVVENIVPNANKLRKSHEFSNVYKRWYTRDLREHLDGPPPDVPRTKRIRPTNVIIGSTC